MVLIASRPVVVWNVIAILINGLSMGAYLRTKDPEPANCSLSS